MLAKEAVFTMKLEPELRDAFMAAAQRNDRSASQVARELMRDFVERQREKEDYLDFYRTKIEKARLSMEAGHFFSTDEVEAEIEELMAELERTDHRKHA